MACAVWGRAARADGAAWMVALLNSGAQNATLRFDATLVGWPSDANFSVTDVWTGKVRVVCFLFTVYMSCGSFSQFDSLPYYIFVWTEKALQRGAGGAWVGSVATHGTALLAVARSPSERVLPTVVPLRGIW